MYCGMKVAHRDVAFANVGFAAAPEGGKKSQNVQVAHPSLLHQAEARRKVQAAAVSFQQVNCD